ncbi:hypothetical protein BMW23_0518 [Bodo saltans virus]|uniref:Uncharacterized protein n=1 Tax=Bodo saltans virus TaxID=2024608 RepID=A0A2H4UUR1_9VIRU|nr:hypothetical protein QJ851_gp0502 [Bodo saltans virus]ATZ80565.1 hypothetical protein BMW23_0518 [Bodo saltans virus]
MINKDKLCGGFFKNLKECHSVALNNSEYCDRHKYLELFDNDEIDAIKNGTTDIKRCSQCELWSRTVSNEHKTCDKCNETIKKICSKKKEKRKEERKECDVIISSGNKCDKEMKQVIDGNNICAIHLRHGNYYFYKDKAKLKFCTMCNKYLPLDLFDGGLCKKCKNTGENNKKKTRIENTKEENKCKHEKCNFANISRKKYDNFEKNEIMKKNKLEKIYSDYCVLHQLEAWKNEVNDNGKKVCYDYNHHGCRKVLEKNDKMRCGDCIEKDNVYEEKRKYNYERFMYTYINNAKQRKIGFFLSIEECYKYFESKCAKCGGDNDSKPMGIDRIDNSVGYFSGNCESCCTFCNWLKRSYNNDTFYSIITHILHNIGLTDNMKSINYTLFGDYSPCTIKDYIDRGEKKSFSMSLTEKEIICIQSLNCYLCGKSSSSVHGNGLDRLNNDKGYELGNVLPCCHDCNLFKWKYGIDEFIIKLYQIYVKQTGITCKYDNNQLKEYICEYIKKKINNVNKILKNVVQMKNDKQ